MLVDMVPFSTVDYPGKIAATLFFAGCNFRCGFCHNKMLVNEDVKAHVSTEEVLTFLSSRIGLLDGVCITGGEAILSPDLLPLIKGIKKMGFLVKLDTNGSSPERLGEIAPYLDFVAMDIKATPQKYPLVTGRQWAWDLSCATVQWLKSSGIAHEFRTTVLPEWHSEEELSQIRSMIGNSTWVLQQYRQPVEGVLDNKEHKAYPNARLKEMAKRLDCKVRGV